MSIKNKQLKYTRSDIRSTTENGRLTEIGLIIASELNQMNENLRKLIKEK